MGRYVQRLGSRNGLRIVDELTGETVVFAGRALDNMSGPAAEEIVRALERRDALHQQHVDSAYERNDLAAILDDLHGAPRGR